MQDGHTPQLHGERVDAMNHSHLQQCFRLPATGNKSYRSNNEAEVDNAVFLHVKEVKQLGGFVFHILSSLKLTTNQQKV